MAALVWQAFAQEQIALVEAGTGTGKTRAYTVPAIRWATEQRERVTISTNTRALQDQLLAELRLLHATAGVARRPWRFAVMKGRANYPCLAKLAEYLGELGPETPCGRRLALAMHLVWVCTAQGEHEGDVAPGWLLRQDARGEARGVFYTVHCDDACPERGCPLYGVCAYYRALARAEQADVVAVNHAMLFASSRWVDNTPRVVLDEAHNLEDAATNALTVEVAGERVRALLESVARIEGKGSSGWRVRVGRAFGVPRGDGVLRDLALAVEEAQAALVGASVALHRFLHLHDHRKREEARYPHSFEYRPVAEKRPWLLAVAPVNVLVAALASCVVVVDKVLEAVAERELADETYSAAGVRAEGSALRRRLVETGDLLRDMLALADHNRVHLLGAPVILHQEGVDVAALEQEPSWCFRALPIDVRPMLAALVYQPARAVVLTSATLTVDSSFAFMRERLGLGPFVDRVVEHTVASPFDYRRQALLALPAHLPAPRASVMTEYLEQLGLDLARYVRAFDGHTLGLFTARAHLETVAAALGNALQAEGRPVYAQGEHGGVDQLVRQFKDDASGILLGVRSLWEGVDIGNPELQHVWIAKLPFQNMSDPLLRARQEALVSENPSANPFEDYLLPLTVLQFKQGFGRLIRRRSDRGAVVVADRRLRASLYRDVFLRSLPDPDLTEESDVACYRAIAAFLGSPLDERLLGALPRSTAETIIEACRLADDGHAGGAGAQADDGAGSLSAAAAADHGAQVPSRRRSCWRPWRATSSESCPRASARA